MQRPDWLGNPKVKVDLNDIPVEKKEEKQFTTRPEYRRGRRPTNVKVYTINDESRYIHIRNIPAIGVFAELQTFLGGHEIQVLDHKETDHFTEIVKVELATIEQVKELKKKCQQIPFYGHLLEIEYAPEYETLLDTKRKLEERKNFIINQI